MGLPVDVITMLLSYYKDKPMGYIEKVAIDWSEKEIDTIEKSINICQDIKIIVKLWVTMV